MVDWKLFSRTAIFATILFTFTLVLSPMARAADAKRGKKLYQDCMVCHGENGMGKASQNAPRLAGQFDWYIVTALKDFQSGARKNPAMKPYIQDLTESDIKDLAAYISTLEVSQEVPQEDAEKNSEK